MFKIGSKLEALRTYISHTKQYGDTLCLSLRYNTAFWPYLCRTGYVYWTTRPCPPYPFRIYTDFIVELPDRPSAYSSCFGHEGSIGTTLLRHPRSSYGYTADYFSLY